jgi:hypothetical protein
VRRRCASADSGYDERDDDPHLLRSTRTRRKTDLDFRAFLQSS